MRCGDIVNWVIEHDGDEDVSFLRRLLIDAHIFFCPRCARELRRWQLGRDLLSASCQDPALTIGGFELPDISGAVMGDILAESGETPDTASGGAEVLSFRRWVVAGCVIVVSLVSVFFCFDFTELSAASGLSLMIPMGVTIGIIISAYSALFIGSHLKELSQRFRLR
ncbi:MAG: peptidoglycan-binding protein [Spirochaetaceae bacterium]|jgi:hypothetical protein|nr:peptidoglycan-binding protein [Spirochaetaceae bacterium]